MVFTNAIYNNIKWFTNIILPAIAVFYMALAKIWALPYPDEIVGTIMAAVLFLQAILGVSSLQYNKVFESLDDPSAKIEFVPVDTQAEALKVTEMALRKSNQVMNDKGSKSK